MLAPPLLSFALRRSALLPSWLLTAKCARFCWIEEDVRSLSLSLSRHAISRFCRIDCRQRRYFVLFSPSPILEQKGEQSTAIASLSVSPDPIKQIVNRDASTLQTAAVAMTEDLWMEGASDGTRFRRCIGHHAQSVESIKDRPRFETRSVRGHPVRKRAFPPNPSVVLAHSSVNRELAGWLAASLSPIMSGAAVLRIRGTHTIPNHTKTIC